MKRACEADAPEPGCAFFALAESTNLLLSSCEGCPRVVALLLRLCCATRAAVWLWLAGTDRARIEWHCALRRRLCEQVPAHCLVPAHHDVPLLHPVFYAACPHMNARTLYLGLDRCRFVLDDSSEEDTEGDAPSDGDYDGCEGLIAVEHWWSATWQPVCCANQQIMCWDFVCSALVHRHDALTELYGRRARATIIAYNENKWNRRALFDGPNTKW